MMVKAGGAAVLSPYSSELAESGGGDYGWGTGWRGANVI